MDTDSFVEINIDFNLLATTTSEDDFMEQSVFLVRELMNNWYILLRMHEGDGLLSRNEAVIHGLFARSFSLSRSFVTLTCNKDDDGSRVVLRSVMESTVNMLYLLYQNSDRLYDDFIQYSLYTERDQYEYIKKHTETVGQTLPIEKRMMSSIMKSFDRSGFKPDNLISGRQNTWKSITLEQKCATIDPDRLYLFLFKQLHHIVHGNWESLLHQHLKFDGGNKYRLNIEKKKPRPQIILGALNLLSNSCISFSLYEFHDEDVKKVLIGVFQKTNEKARKIDSLHEEYLNMRK